MKKIAIVGAGPTGIYTLFSLLKNPEPLCISVYEQGREAGVGMPYSKDENSKVMLANIASIEIPPLFLTYLEWLQNQSEEHLARYGVHKSTLHSRQFLPRILLGEYFRDRFLDLVMKGKERGFEVNVHESCQITDLEATAEGVRIWAEGKQLSAVFDLAVIATGHVWPEESATTRTFFPSPWSGLMEAKIKACRVGIMGTSLSGIDAAMAVVVQHGKFVETGNEPLQFTLDDQSKALNIVLMSRTGVLPEADFYCPIPYEPLSVLTPSAIEKEISAGAEGLLTRVFKLMVEEIERADPVWSEGIWLRNLDPDSFTDAWFANRKKHDPFDWAQSNLLEVERNKRDRRTVPWRYAILRLHEAVQEIVPYLDNKDRVTFDSGLARVFIDNYAAIPSQSIRRLLALHQSGIIRILALGPDYKMEKEANQTVISIDENSYEFDVFIDARGQKPLQTKDLPFPTLRKQLEAAGDDFPDVGDDYTLLAPGEARGRIAFGALPYLMHDQPFVQGITVCAEIGAAIAKAVVQPTARARKKLPFIDM